MRPVKAKLTGQSGNSRFQVRITGSDRRWVGFRTGEEENRERRSNWIGFVGISVFIIIERPMQRGQEVQIHVQQEMQFKPSVVQLLSLQMQRNFIYFSRDVFAIHLFAVYLSIYSTPVVIFLLTCRKSSLHDERAHQKHGFHFSLFIESDAQFLAHTARLWRKSCVVLIKLSLIAAEIQEV